MFSLVDDCQINAIQCSTTVLTCLYTLITLSFSFWCMVKTYRIGGGASFEQLPLAASFLQSTLQFLQNFLVEDIRLLLGSQFVQAISFIFVAMSFSLLYFRSQQQIDIATPTLDSYSRTLRIQRIIKLSLLASIAGILVTAIVVLIRLKEGDCAGWFGTQYYIPLSMSGIAALISMVFGLKLRNKIIKESLLMQPAKKQQQYKNKSMRRTSTISSLINSDSQHSDDLKKQVNIILITYTITIIAQIILNLIRTESFGGKISCENSYQFLSLENDVEIFLFFLTIVEVTPCVIIPYVFYYIPFAQKHKNLKNTKDFEIDSSITTSSNQTNQQRLQDASNTNHNVKYTDNSNLDYEDKEKSGTVSGINDLKFQGFKKSDYNVGSIYNDDL